MRVRKSITILGMTLALALAPATIAGAAKKTTTSQTETTVKLPGKVATLKAEAKSETTAQLSWSKASRAEGYILYIKNQTAGTEKKVKTTERKILLKSLTPGNKYVYQVYAYRTVDGKRVMATEGSTKVSLKTSVIKPATPKNLKLSKYAHKAFTLKWDKAKNATGYEIYAKGKSGEYVLLGRTKKTTYTTKTLTVGVKYQIKVRSYRTVRGVTKTGGYSNQIQATAQKIQIATIHGRYFKASTKYRTTATVVSTGKKVTLNKGTSLTAANRTSNTVTAFLSNGTEIRISGMALSYGNLEGTTKFYTVDQKELYVNSRGFSSSTGWLIWVNQYTMTTTVFRGSQGRWKQVRTMACVVGRYGLTPVGERRIVMKMPLYGEVGVFLSWNAAKQQGIAFHKRMDSNIRAAVSGGCIRLGISDLYYIYNNCPIGTTVICY
ncbi:MAG: fibronectin type III domain-containing protein [Lachnospiraceae bacterium]|nr:fibronectin type III domain-containing protein [Lachnospiraceae bacterium]